jgi:hypothetical protein
MAIRSSDKRRAMKILGPIGAGLAAMAMSLVAHPALAAGKFDGSAPFLCVPVVVIECAPDGPDAECKRRTAASVNLPQFLRVDLKSSKVHAEGGGRESPVRNIEHLSGNLIIQGGQDGRGWTMTISEETGRMSATISSDGDGFVVFGACTLP